MPASNRFEARATKLAGALKQRVNVYSQAITPPGARPPFTRPYSEPRALQAILDHWSHPATQAWISAMDPQQQLELHNAIGNHIRGLMPNLASPMASNPLAAGGYRAGMNVS